MNEQVYSKVKLIVISFDIWFRYYQPPGLSSFDFRLLIPLLWGKGQVIWEFDKLWGYFKVYYALKGFWLEIWQIIMFQIKMCSWTFETLCIRVKYIDAIINSMNMMFKENNGNAIIMKCYANYEFQYDV